MHTKIHYTFFLLFFLLTLSVHSELPKITVQISGGYGFSFNNQLVDFEGTINRDSTFKKYKDIYSSLGNGLKIDLDLRIPLNQTFSLAMSSGVSILGGWEAVFKNDITDEINTYTMHANYIPLLVGFICQSRSKPVAPYIRFSPGILIPFGVYAEDTYEGSGYGEVTDIEEYTFATGFAMSSGLGFTIKPRNPMRLFFEINPFFASARIKEITYETATASGDIQRETILYLKDEGDLPETEVSSDGLHIWYYDTGGITMPFSSIAVKFGIVLSF